MIMIPFFWNFQYFCIISNRGFHSTFLFTHSNALNPLAAHLKKFRQQDRLNAGSLIISVLGDAVMPRGGRIALGSLIGLMAPFGVGERWVRTAVFRLVKADWLKSLPCGRKVDYQLTSSGLQRFEESACHIYAKQAPVWDGQWRLVTVLSDLPSRKREQLRRALYWQGFGELRAGCFVHPGADLTAVLDALVSDGLGELKGSLAVFRATSLEFSVPVAPAPGQDLLAASKDWVAQTWPLAHLAQAYADFVALYAPLEKHLRASCAPVDEELAFLCRTLLIHDYRRLMLRDPELPQSLLPAAWPGEQARHLCRDLYERLWEASESHLQKNLHLADGQVPEPGGS
jgi:phenylacetic acid degradation operon negative regulatory protein